MGFVRKAESYLSSGTTEQKPQNDHGTYPGIIRDHPFTREISRAAVHVLFQEQNKDSFVVVVSYGMDKTTGCGFKELGYRRGLIVWSMEIMKFTRQSMSPLKPYNFGQVIVKNEAPSHFYLDGMYPLEER